MKLTVVKLCAHLQPNGYVFFISFGLNRSKNSPQTVAISASLESTIPVKLHSRRARCINPKHN